MSGPGLGLGLEEIAARVRAGGWDGMESISALARQAHQQQDAKTQAVADDFAMLFATAPGRKVFNHLADRILWAPAWSGRPEDGIEQLAARGLRREGQNEIVAFIAAMVARGLNLPAWPNANTEFERHVHVEEYKDDTGLRDDKSADRSPRRPAADEAPGVPDPGYPSGQVAFLRSWGFQFHGISSSMGLIRDQQRVPAPM